MIARAEEACERLISDYAQLGEPITTRFRDLVPDAALPDRATHLVHPYPAKLLPHIPIFLLSCERFSRPGDLVVDPFCGSGTVLVEAVLAGRTALGADANPFARQLAEAKIASYAIPQFEDFACEDGAWIPRYRKV